MEEKKIDLSKELYFSDIMSVFMDTFSGFSYRHQQYEHSTENLLLKLEVLKGPLKTVVNKKNESILDILVNELCKTDSQNNIHLIDFVRRIFSMLISKGVTFQLSKHIYKLVNVFTSNRTCFNKNTSNDYKGFLIDINEYAKQCHNFDGDLSIMTLSTQETLVYQLIDSGNKMGYLSLPLITALLRLFDNNGIEVSYILRYSRSFEDSFLYRIIKEYDYDHEFENQLSIFIINMYKMDAVICSDKNIIKSVKSHNDTINELESMQEDRMICKLEDQIVKCWRNSIFHKLGINGIERCGMSKSFSLLRSLSYYQPVKKILDGVWSYVRFLFLGFFKGDQKKCCLTWLPFEVIYAIKAYFYPPKLYSYYFDWVYKDTYLYLDKLKLFNNSKNKLRFDPDLPNDL